MSRHTVSLALVALVACCLVPGFKFEQQISKESRLVPLEICYDALGCFSMGGNFYDILRRPLQLLPQSPDYVQPTYALYTRQNVISPQILQYGDSSSFSNSFFNAKRPTKIIIHGFLENGNVSWMVEMKKALLLHGDYNVVQLDWSKGSKLPYTQSTANTRVVGALIAQLIKWIETKFGANREAFHLLGHSLGAHISGYAGERLRNDAKQLGRITGLDPAGPYFEDTHPEVRLDPTDARFVDVIHTDGDSLLSSIKLEGGLGLMQPLGHVDFYPNGGKKQPDCSRNPITNIIINGIVEGSKWTIACYHMRVLPLMTSTIINLLGDYKAFPCDSYEDFKAGKCADCGASGCASMGMRAIEWKPNGRVNVKMFLETTGKSPFELHNFVAKITVSGIADAKRQYGDLMFTLEGADGSKSSELKVLSKTYMNPGEQFSLVLTTTDAVFDISRLTVSWKHQWLATLLTQRLHLNRVEIFEAFKEKRSLFCAKDASIESGKSLMLAKSSIC